MSNPAAGPRKINKGQYLFRENDNSDAMFVIKSGRIAITKAKGAAEIVLAELGPGQMLGEMAFFDNRPRSASAKAIQESDVIALPFQSLYAQFKTFPEWLKAMVKTINSNLRDANLRIRSLEKASLDDDMALSPNRIIKLLSILGLVAHRFGELKGEKIELSGNVLRRYTIQVFGEPTNKMQKLTEALTQMGHMTIEELGEGRQKLTIYKLNLIISVVEFYTDYLFKDESKRTPIEANELNQLKAVLYYAKQQPNPADGKPVKIDLVEVHNNSVKDLGYLVKPDEMMSLVEKKIVGDPMTAEGRTFVPVDTAEVERLYTYWEIIHGLLKVRN